MTVASVIALAVLLFGWSVVSGRLERLDVTGPIVFVAAGLLLCNGPWAVVDVDDRVTRRAPPGRDHPRAAPVRRRRPGQPAGPPPQRRAPDPPARHRPSAHLRARRRARRRAVHRSAVGAGRPAGRRVGPHRCRAERQRRVRRVPATVDPALVERGERPQRRHRHPRRHRPHRGRGHRDRGRRHRGHRVGSRGTMRSSTW